MTRQELLKLYASGQKDFTGVDLSGEDLSGLNLIGVETILKFYVKKMKKYLKFSIY